MSSRSDGGSRHSRRSCRPAGCGSCPPPVNTSVWAWARSWPCPWPRCLTRSPPGKHVPWQQLAQSVGRGRRSSIGTHGFAQGGLLFELGKRADQPLATLADRVELPRAWRVVQIRPRGEAGLWGEAENNAFRQLATRPCPSHRTARSRGPTTHAAGGPDRATGGLWRERLPLRRPSRHVLRVPAGRAFRQFVAGALGEGNSTSGNPGVGQSSWGPTLFAFLGDEDSAQEFTRWFRHDVLTHSSASLMSLAHDATRGPGRSIQTHGLLGDAPGVAQRPPPILLHSNRWPLELPAAVMFTTLREPQKRGRESFIGLAKRLPTPFLDAEKDSRPNPVRHDDCCCKRAWLCGKEHERWEGYREKGTGGRWGEAIQVPRSVKGCSGWCRCSGLGVVGLQFFQVRNQLLFIRQAREIEADHLVRAERRLAPGPQAD